MLNLEPKTLWQCFFEICQVPRPSKKRSKSSVSYSIGVNVTE